MLRNRQLELARYARCRKKRSLDPLRKEKQNQHARESARRYRHERNEPRCERSWRLGAGRKEIAHGDALAELSEMQMRHPRFTWLDQNGRLQVELWESPEQLADRLRKEGQLWPSQKPS